LNLDDLSRPMHGRPGKHFNGAAERGEAVTAH